MPHLGSGLSHLTLEWAADLYSTVGLDFPAYGSGTSGSPDRWMAGFAPDWRVWTEVTDIRDRIAAIVRPSSCAVCGIPLMRTETGRPRLVCSLRCRRMRDNTLRLIRRRRAWLESWHRVRDITPQKRRVRSRRLNARSERSKRPWPAPWRGERHLSPNALLSNLRGRDETEPEGALRAWRTADGNRRAHACGFSQKTIAAGSCVNTDAPTSGDERLNRKAARPARRRGHRWALAASVPRLIWADVPSLPD
jgi:hypothetical protein